MNIEKQSISFIKKLFHIYLELRDFDTFLDLLDENISWIGTGIHEFCSNFNDVKKIVEVEKKSQDNQNNKFKILEQLYKSIVINDEFSIIYGKLKIQEDNLLNPFLISVHSEFSMVCKTDIDSIKLVHAHLSVANEYQHDSQYNTRLKLENELHLKTLQMQTIYKVALKTSNAVIFDYIIDAKQIIHPQSSMDKFGLPHIIENAIESSIWLGIIHPNSVENFRNVYKKIDMGEPVAETTIVLLDKQGTESINKISLTNVYNEDGKPIRAIGILIDITEKSILQSENQYRKSMDSDKLLTYEANISRNTIISLDKNWVETLNIPPFNSFLDMIDYMCANLIHPDYVDEFRNFSNKETIINFLNENKFKVSIQYMRKDYNHLYSWVKNTMNIIRDYITNDIKIRCYMSIINEQKEKEMKILEEQHFFEAMISKSAIVYEINVTKDVFIRGHENWDKLFGIKPTNNYSEMIYAFITKSIYCEDILEFNKAFLRENILAAFNNGKNEIYCEYRRPNEKGNLIWVSCTMHLLQDIQTNDIKGFSYIENINEEKCKELELIYKSEHDVLTELYNKATTEKLIADYLLTDKAKATKHAFIIFDIDYFKHINDNFGHAFGDVVLSEVARKIKELFREDDILGRIGGDEFAVFMKAIPNTQVVSIKANEMCEAVRESYTQNGKEYKISISIGIAIYDKYGSNYEELYKHSDTALYFSKRNGRNQYSFYTHDMTSTKLSINKIETDKFIGIQANEFIENKSFADNVSDYVFRILYESADKVKAINSVLELIGKYYNTSRVYIFEDSSDGNFTSNTFEWCNKKILPQARNLQKIPYNCLGDYKSNFNDMGVFQMYDITKANKDIKGFLELQEIKSMLQFAIVKNKKFAGFIGFDQCDFARIPSKREISELKNISNILGVFIMEMRAIAMNEATKNVALSIVNGLDCYSYVIDKKTYKLLFINEKTMIIAPDTKKGDYCYKAFWGQDIPCEQCPMNGLSDENNCKHSMELYNTKFNLWLKSTASWIEWTDGKRSCLVNSFDITEYKIGADI